MGNWHVIFGETCIHTCEERKDCDSEEVAPGSAIQALLAGTHVCLGFVYSSGGVSFNNYKRLRYQRYRYSTPQKL